MNQPNNLWDDRPYRPTSVTISIDEWDRMNEELQALRQWKEAAIKSSSWNVKHEGKPYTWTSGKHDRTLDPDTSKEYGWQPKEDENYFAWDTDFGVQSFVNLNPEMGRIDMERFGRLFPTKEAAEAYGRTTTTNALLPLMELKMAVDRGETIVDEVGNTIVKHPNGYDYNSLLWLDGFTKSWEAMVSNYMSKSKGWRIERTEPDNYSEILAELHLGKTFQAEDGTEIWKRRNEGVAGVGMGIALIAPWSDVVEQILKRHKGWRKV